MDLYGKKGSSPRGNLIPLNKAKTDNMNFEVHLDRSWLNTFWASAPNIKPQLYNK